MISERYVSSLKRLKKGFGSLLHHPSWISFKTRAISRVSARLQLVRAFIQRLSILGLGTHAYLYLVRFLGISLTKIMWHQKQNNMIFPSQVIGMEPQTEENVQLKPPGVSDRVFMEESSRKRKGVAMDQPLNNTSDDISHSLWHYIWPTDSNQKHNVDAFQGMNVQGNTLGVISNLTSQYVEPNIKVLQSERYQFQSPNNLSTSSQINDGNFPSPTLGKMIRSSSSAQPHSFHQEGLLTSINSPYNLFSQIEDNKFPLYPNPSNTNMNKSELGHGLKDGMNFGLRNHMLRDNSLLEMHGKFSESLGTLGASQLKIGGFAHYLNLDGRTCIRDVGKTGSSFEVKQSVQSLGVVGKETDQSCQNSSTEIRISSLDNGGAAHLKGRDQSYGDRDTQNRDKTDGSNVGNSKNSLGEEVLPKNADNPSKILVGNEHGDDLRKDSHNLDGKSTPRAAKVAPTNVEKLWDGSLQLNASITVSAVAFFKSGEKAPDINWSKSIEVKGKVRLEAFEKFIQELPRSRSRALMVTSLCWKVGSSKTGLKGMKEVTKGYKEGERVGFAQLSPGIDLYVCPRSDTIITILAKYGFFKGMAAVEDNQDSLIGCVVWRRNRKSSVTSSKKSDRKKLSVSEQPNAEANAPLIQAGRASSPPGSETGPSAIESSGNTGIESKNIHSSEVQTEAGKTFTELDPKLIQLIRDNSPTISMGFQASMHSDARSVGGPMRLEVEVPLVQGSGREKSDNVYDLPRPVISAQPKIGKTFDGPAPDDDDLPEFDFNATCGPRNIKRVSNSGQLDKRLPAIGSKNVGGSVPCTLPLPPIVQPMIIANQQRPRSPNFPGLPLDTRQGMPHSSKKLGEGQSIRPVVPFPKKPMTHSGDLPGKPGISKQDNRTAWHPPKNLWEDDDDDMPEWCPPNVECRKQSQTIATSRPSIPCIPLPVPNPTSKKLPHGPLLPRPLPAPPMSVCPPLHPQELPHGYQPCPITITVKPAQTRPIGGHVQFGPISSLGFNSNPNLRPPSNLFDVKHPIRPADWRGWRP